MNPPLVLMVAPNGARRTKQDHPELPVTIAETTRTVAACASTGASAAHVHVRDAQGRHVLDAEAYRTLCAAIGKETPQDFVCQITTEAVGRYSPAEQMAVVRDVRPRAVSIGLRELAPDEADVTAAADFYAWCYREEIAVQHILYDTVDLTRFIDLVARGDIAGDRHSVLFVLGRYTTNQESDASMLLPFLKKVDEAGRADALDWMICAFGRGETAAAAAAMALGGHVRLGFENSLWAPDGSLRADNVETVAGGRAIAEALARPPAGPQETLRVLGGR